MTALAFHRLSIDIASPYIVSYDNEHEPTETTNSHMNDRDRETYPSNETNPFASPQGIEQHTPSSLTDGKLNPFFSMWTEPRATMRYILDTNPTRHVILISCVVGISRSMGRAVRQEDGELGLIATLVLTTAIGSVYGIISLFLSAWLVGAIANALGGKANQVEMRAAMSWGSIIYCWMLPIVIIMLALVSTTDGLQGPYAIPLVFLTIVMGVLSIWSIVVLSKAVGEANQFSAWRGFAAISIAFIVAMVLMLGIAFAIMAAFMNSALAV
ncbi:MAG: Yip1 family protein [Planctomycetota bacterium]